MVASMSTTKDQTARPRAVTVAVEVDVPFTTTTTVAFRGEDKPSSYTVELTVDLGTNGDPVLLGFAASRALSAEELQRIDWRRTLVYALYSEGRRRHLLTTASEDDGPVDNLVVATKRRRRRSFTDADLDKVVEAYEAGGAEEVAQRFTVGLRQASRYVGRAREKGLL
jgi:hypothetical protein